MSPSAISPSAANLTTTELTASAVAHAQGPAPQSKSPLDASRLTYTYNKEPKVVPSQSDPIVWEQNNATDHMITVKWTEKVGWHTPELKPYGPLMLMPTAHCLHYATEAFVRITNQVEIRKITSLLIILSNDRKG